MNPTAFFLEDRTNLLVGVLAVGLFAAGVFALVREQAVATIFLMLGGFVLLMLLEYRSTVESE
jgi:hypothetical protein